MRTTAKVSLPATTIYWDKCEKCINVSALYFLKHISKYPIFRVLSSNIRTHKIIQKVSKSILPLRSILLYKEKTIQGYSTDSQNSKKSVLIVANIYRSSI